MRSDADRLSDILAATSKIKDMHQVWTMAQRDVPKLEEQVQNILSQLASEAGYAS
jgi:peptidoglycan hydrolase CwlO-like protein